MPGYHNTSTTPSVSVFKRHKVTLTDTPEWLLTPAELVDWIATGRNPKRGDVDVHDETLKGADLILKLAAHHGGKAGAKAARKRARDAAKAHNPVDPTDAEADALLSEYEASKNRKPAAMQGEAEARSADALIAHSGIAVVDVDGLQTRKAAESARDRLGACPETQCAWLSSSRHGAQARVRIAPNPWAVAQDAPADTLLRLNLNATKLTAALHREAFTEAVEPWFAELGIDGGSLDMGYASNLKFHAVTYDADAVATYMDGAAAIAWDSAAALERIAARIQKQRHAQADAAADDADGGFTLADYQSALWAIDPSGHDKRVRVAAGAKSAGVSEDEVRRWSDSARAGWLTPNRWAGLDNLNYTAGTLIHIAREDGWQPPKRGGAQSAGGKGKGKGKGKRATQNVRVMKWLRGGIKIAGGGYSVIEGTRGKALAGSVVNAEAALHLVGLGRGYRSNEWTRRIESAACPDGEFRIEDEAQIARRVIERAGEYSPTLDAVRGAITGIARDNAYHPIRDAIAALPAWDGVDRSGQMSALLSIDTRAVDEGLANRMAWLLVKGLIARGTDPGFVKFDYCPIFYSATQGLGKGSLLEHLVLDKSWFATISASVFTGFDVDKRMREALQGTLLAEIAEIEVMDRRSWAEFKQVVTKRAFNGRVAWGRESTTDIIRGVFAGTTNTERMLGDDENRRFVVLPIRDYVDMAALVDARPQIYAQAWSELKRDYPDGVDHLVLPRKDWSVAREHEARHRFIHPFQEFAEEWLDEQVGEGRFYITPAALTEAWKQSVFAEGRGIQAKARGSIMAALGWAAIQVGDKRTRTRYWALRDCAEHAQRKARELSNAGSWLMPDGSAYTAKAQEVIAVCKAVGVVWNADSGEFTSEQGG